MYLLKDIHNSWSHSTKMITVISNHHKVFAYKWIKHKYRGTKVENVTHKPNLSLQYLLMFCCSLQEKKSSIGIAHLVDSKLKKVIK